MKTKSLLVIVAALILLSFTVVTKQSTKEEIGSTKAQPAQTSTGSGFAMEDRNQW